MKVQTLFPVVFLILLVVCSGYAEEGDVPTYRLRPSQKEPVASDFISKEKASEITASEEFLEDKQAQMEYMRNKGSSLYIGKKPWMKKKRDREKADEEKGKQKPATEMDVFLYDKMKEQEAKRKGLLAEESDEDIMIGIRSREASLRKPLYEPDELKTDVEKPVYEQPFNINYDLMMSEKVPADKLIETRKEFSFRKQTLEDFGKAREAALLWPPRITENLTRLVDQHRRAVHFDEFTSDPILVLFRDGTLFEYYRDYRTEKD